MDALESMNDLNQGFKLLDIIKIDLEVIVTNKDHHDQIDPKEVSMFQFLGGEQEIQSIHKDKNEDNHG